MTTAPPTTPGVPSPQEELRAEIEAVLVRSDMSLAAARGFAVSLAPLFAARVAAIEEQLRLCNIDQINVEAELSQEVHVDMLVAANNEQHDLAVFHSQRAEKAEADLAAMTAEAEKWRIKSAVLDAVFAERDQLRADLTAAQERIAAVTAERDDAEVKCGQYQQMWQQVAAERTQAAAQAFAEGWNTDYPVLDDGERGMPINPYTGECVEEW